jgi:hypothetical protein
MAWILPLALIPSASANQQYEIDHHKTFGWDLGALATINGTPVSCASLCWPLIYLTVVGAIAYSFNAAIIQPGEEVAGARMGMFYTILILAFTAPQAEEWKESGNGLMRPAIYLSLWFFIIHHWSAMMLQTGMERGRCLLRFALAGIIVLIGFSIAPIRAYLRGLGLIGLVNISSLPFWFAILLCYVVRVITYAIIHKLRHLGFLVRRRRMLSTMVYMIRTYGVLQLISPSAYPVNPWRRKDIFMVLM